MEKKYPYDCFVVSGIQNYVAMADILMPQTQQPIITIIFIRP